MINGFWCQAKFQAKFLSKLEIGIAESLLLLWYNMIFNDKERIRPGKEE